MSNFKKIEELKKEIADLEAEDIAYNALTPEEQLAITLHSNLCRYNHTDGCGWFYEMKKCNIDNWGGEAHQRWLTKAQIIMLFCQNNKIDTKVAVDLMHLLEK